MRLKTCAKVKTHEDERRKLIDWSDDLDIATCKLIIAKEDCTLGNHYHKLKTERFMLLSGRARGTASRERIVHTWDLEEFKPYTVSPYLRHSFELKKGAILACLVDKPYSSDDDFTD